MILMLRVDRISKNATYKDVPDQTSSFWVFYHDTVIFNNERCLESIYMYTQYVYMVFLRLLQCYLINFIWNFCYGLNHKVLQRQGQEKIKDGENEVKTLNK